MTRIEVNLNYLDLRGTKIETLPEQVLGKLVNLQYVVTNSVMDEENTKLEVEGLYCEALNVETFNAWARLLEHSSFQQYNLAMNGQDPLSGRSIHQIQALQINHVDPDCTT